MSTSPLQNISPSKESSRAKRYDFFTIRLGEFIRQVREQTVDPEILEEFIVAIRDKDQAYIVKLITEINELETNFNLVQLIVSRLQAGIDDDIAKENGLMTRADLIKALANLIPVRDTDTLSVIITRSKALLSDIQAKKEELRRVMPTSKPMPLDDRFFAKLIAEVEQFTKTPVVRDTKYLCDFVESIRNMKEAYEQFLRQQNQLRNGK